MKPELTVLLVSRDIRDSELNDMIIAGYRRFISTRLGSVLSIAGFDDDPRELSDIPEAMELAKRLISFGMLSVLHLTTTLDPGQMNGVPGLGALELLRVSRGQPMSREITKEEAIAELEECDERIIKSNPIVERKVKNFDRRHRNN